MDRAVLTDDENQIAITIARAAHLTSSPGVIEDGALTADSARFFTAGIWFVAHVLGYLLARFRFAAVAILFLRNRIRIFLPLAAGASMKSIS